MNKNGGVSLDRQGQGRPKGKGRGVDLTKYNAYMDAVLGRMNTLIRKKRMDPLRVNLYGGPSKAGNGGNKKKGENSKNGNGGSGPNKNKNKKKSSPRMNLEDDDAFRLALNERFNDDFEEDDEDESRHHRVEGLHDDFAAVNVTINRGVVVERAKR
jgi:hypothetical protein